MAAVTTSHRSSPPVPPHPPLYSFGVPWPDHNEGLLYTDLSSKVLVSFLLFASIRIATTLIEFYSSKYKNSAPLQGFVGRRKPSCMFSLSYCFGIGANMFSCILGQLASKNTQSPVVYHRLPWKEPFAPYLLDVLYEDNDMVAGMRTARYQAIPPKINRRRPIEGEIDRRRSIEGEKGKKKKRKRRKKEKRSTYFPAPSSSAHRRCPRVASACASSPPAGRGRFFSRARRWIVSLRGEKGRGDVASTFLRPVRTVRYRYRDKLGTPVRTGKPALSKVQVLERDAQRNQAVVQVEIHSGRPHQIRIHLAFAGHPLIGKFM
ncbi:hypothetical protein BHM03_00010053 [Ensete ventricosum]|nr:hypothetical protein BHM03_00010053 [Ensete ventricosum]